MIAKILKHGVAVSGPVDKNSQRLVKDQTFPLTS